MINKSLERQKAKTALQFIIPILNKYGFRWVITGGFASYAYGVDRKLTDIDIDIEASKDDNLFKEFYEEVKNYLTQPLEHFVDENYDNYNFEITYDDQIIDICPMSDLRLYNVDTKKYESFYNDTFPDIELTVFEGFELPLLSKKLVIQNKETLTRKDEWHQRDIDQLRRLL